MSSAQPSGDDHACFVVVPVTRTVLVRERWPLTISTWPRRTPKCSASNSTTRSLADPSTGAHVVKVKGPGLLERVAFAQKAKHVAAVGQDKRAGVLLGDFERTRFGGGLDDISADAAGTVLALLRQNEDHRSNNQEKRQSAGESAEEK